MLSEMSSSLESSSSTRVREEKRRLESVFVREKRRLIVLFYYIYNMCAIIVMMSVCSWKTDSTATQIERCGLQIINDAVSSRLLRCVVGVIVSSASLWLVVHSQEDNG